MKPAFTHSDNAPSLTQQAKLRELRSYLSRLWRYQRPGSRRRELTRGLVQQIDRLREAGR